MIAMLHYVLYLVMAVLFFHGTAFASGSIELGAVLAGDTTSITVKGNVAQDHGAFTSELSVNALRVRAGGETTDDKLTLTAQSNRALSPRLYVLGLVRHDKDPSNGYHKRQSYLVGVGYPILDGRIGLTVDELIGLQRTDPVDAGRLEEFGGSVNIKLSIAMSESVTFEAKASLERSRSVFTAPMDLTLSVRASNQLHLNLNHAIKYVRFRGGKPLSDAVSVLTISYGF